MSIAKDIMQGSLLARGTVEIFSPVLMDNKQRQIERALYLLDTN